MRSRLPAIPLLFFCAQGAGCMRALPPMPGVAVVAPAKGTAIHEEGAASGPADTDDGDEDDAEADFITPCKEGSVAQLAADHAVDSFGRRVRVLAPTADPKPFEQELESLLEHPCLELAKADPKDLLSFDSALSLRHWWEEGGSDWLRSYLSLEQHRSVRIAPTPRHALTLETAPKGHPLMPLLCPADESKPCALESTGWTRRAKEKLGLVARRYHSKDEVDCRAQAEKEPKAERYASFRDCVEASVERARALPIGRFKAPSDGWLVFVDDYSNCRGLREFDLATGAAYDASDCGGSLTITTGRVPVGALREAAWMLFLARETQGGVRFSTAFTVPDKIAIKRSRGETIGLGTIGCGCGPSDRHSWSWMREKNGVYRGQVSGTLVGRGGDDDATRHAFDLLDIAEAAFDKGCAPAPPPSPGRIAWSSPGASSKEGETAILDDPASEPVRVALSRAKAPTCPAKF